MADINNIKEILKARFDKNTARHKNISWGYVEKRLSENVMLSLIAMENTGGEPDIIGFDEESKSYIYCDCSKESPNRRSLCYDKSAREGRKKAPPENDAETMAESMGIKLLDEAMYNLLQSTGDYDFKSSSWIKTPHSMRKLGGALFGDKRYGRVFIYHNGADSYYQSRGFRGFILI